jgi:hypothetical protein
MTVEEAVVAMAKREGGARNDREGGAGNDRKKVVLAMTRKMRC